LEVSPAQFISEIENAGLSEEERGELVRQSLVDMLGELPAITTIAYSGNGGKNPHGFAARLCELYGPSCTRILGFIVECLRLKVTSTAWEEDQRSRADTR
jgi:hypothetical protein